MNLEILITFSIIFFLNLITSALSQLKYVLANKSKSWEMYALIGIDTLILFMVFKISYERYFTLGYCCSNNW